MQVMVYHRINRRNVENGGEGRRKPSPADCSSTRSGRKDSTIFPHVMRAAGRLNRKKNVFRAKRISSEIKSKKHFIGNIGHPHSGEKIVLPGMVRLKGYQFREMSQERHHHGNDDDCQYIFIYIYFHTANILISFLHAVTYIPGRKRSWFPFHPCIDFEGAVYGIDLLADRQQCGIERLLSHAVHAELNAAARGGKVVEVFLVGGQAKEWFRLCRLLRRQVRRH